MELKAAIAAVEGMKNLFRSFERVEEVLRLAAQAEQLVKERGEQAAKLTEEIDDRKADLEGLYAEARKAHEIMANERRAHEAALADAEVKSTEQRAARLAEFTENFEKAMKLANEQKSRLDTEVRMLADEKEILSEAVTSLKSELHALKSRIAGV